ncbi:unnamed protein product, partial [Allacma fusca]
AAGESPENLNAINRSDSLKTLKGHSLPQNSEPASDAVNITAPGRSPSPSPK